MIGGYSGAKVPDRQGEKKQQVFHAELQPVSHMREVQGLSQEVRNLPNLLSQHGLEGRDTGCGEVQLVGCVEVVRLIKELTR